MPLCPVCQEDVKVDNDGVNFAFHSRGGRECAGSHKLARAPTNNLNYAFYLRALRKERNMLNKSIGELTSQREGILKEIETALKDAKAAGWDERTLAEMDLAS